MKRKMRISKMAISLLLCLGTIYAARAQAPTFDQDVVDVPLDNGLLWLLIPAVLLLSGIFKGKTSKPKEIAQ
jgi:hypothetical protein